MTLRQDVSNYGNIPMVEEGNSTVLLYVGGKRNILVKDNSKIPYSGT